MPLVLILVISALVIAPIAIVTVHAQELEVLDTPGEVEDNEVFSLNMTITNDENQTLEDLTIRVGILSPEAADPNDLTQVFTVQVTDLEPNSTRNVTGQFNFTYEDWMEDGPNNVSIVALLVSNGTIVDRQTFRLDLVVEEELEVVWWKTLLALVPLVVVFVGILVFKLSSRYVAPFVLIIVTIPIALLAFKEGSIMDSMERIGVVVGYSVSWGLLDYVYSIFGAFFFLEALKKTGALMFIKDDFKRISNDRQHLILLIGFCFAMILAVVAPAGSNFVIAAMMLLSLGFNRYGVGMLCLFGNSISSVFGLLGVAVVALAEVTELDLLVLSGQIGLFMAFLTVLTPLWMNVIYTRKGLIKDLQDPDLREDIVLLLAMGGVYAAVQFLVAWFLGPQLPTILAGAATLLVLVLAEKTFLKRRLSTRLKSFKKRPKKVDPMEWVQMVFKTKSYYMPFFIMIILLMFIQLVVPRIWFLDTAFSIVDIPLTFSAINKTVTFNIIKSPGTLVVLSTLTIPLFRKNWPPKDKVRIWRKEEEERMRKEGIIVDETSSDGDHVYEKRRCPNCDETVDMSWPECPICEEILVEDAEGYAQEKLRKEAEENEESEKNTPFKGKFGPKLKSEDEYPLLIASLLHTSKTIVPILISISCFIAIANVMKYFGMTTSIATTLIYFIGDYEVIYVFFIPIIGMLGSGLTGSTTTSNVLFGGLHIEAASKLGLSFKQVSAAQVLGSTTGEMISPMNAVVVATAVGLKDKESLLIRRMLPSFFLWLSICIATTFFFIYVL